MAFEESVPSAGPGPRIGLRFLGEGFRSEPELRDQAEATPPAVTVGGRPDSEATLSLTRRVPPPNLSHVFDDPAEGEPGRDRMLVHGLWELALAGALAALGLFLAQADSAVFGPGLRDLLISASVLGALAVGSAVALRAGTANLAVGAVAVAAALYFGHNSGGGLLAPLAVVLGVAAVTGAVLGLVVVVLHVPAWAASVGVGLALLAWSGRQSAVTVPDGYDPLPHAYLWFGAICAISIIGAVAGLVPPVRRAIGRFRPVADPARRRGTVAALFALLAMVCSTVLAGLAGVLLVAQTRQAAPSDGLELTALGLGAALLGGTSAFGRRGGVLGTMLAVGLLTLGQAYGEAVGRTWSAASFAAVAIGLGLAVTRLVERFGRPAQGDEDADEDEEEWVPRTAGWSTGRSWQAPPASGIWAPDESWGSGGRP